MSSFQSRWLGFTPKGEKNPDTRKTAPCKTCKSPETPPSTPVALSAPDTLPRLPWQLEALLRAASSNLLPTDSVQLPSGLCHDLTRYVLAWAASYLVGDREEALRRLWHAHAAWARKDVN